MSTKAIRIHAHGGPEVLRWDDVPTPEPGPGEALIHHEAVGLNYIDIYFRIGLYKIPHLPATLGLEGAGVVRAIGAGVTEVAIGDRVAYAGGPIGAYATERVIAADRLVKLPDAIDFATGAAMMLQGMTAQYLLRRTYRVKAGETILVHAAAGGVGLILCQWAKHLGARVIGVVSTEAKAEIARAHGADHVVIGHGGLSAEVKRLTEGAMVPVVYDSVGKDTFSASLDCLAPLGLMISYGNASGPVPPVDLGTLAAKGSLFLTRPTLATYTARRDDLVAVAGELFDVVAQGVVKIRVNQTFPLAEAAAAQEALEARRTTGSTVLIP
ncbi:quinone oxidoreductase family protein [Acidiphilium acidophilum]|uniref:Quinone oxidoreductase n=1 Tax=Acidiphilium acidophilum TaxID=76588 RepID=A0AAW9DXK4_ACIAO|nr:quinone oxidoreductase [Acidiphilium acidophilum]MDX5932825.1 quinone oxidoreductase [Acidiphilium acidophilum]MEE3500064.1 quinone oxidoreductase [Acidiphilium acidophilum]GBR76466.1 zinc-dependent alcohol dehydrogenase [Acidiphilium acidophilum DSM 700]